MVGRDGGILSDRRFGGAQCSAAGELPILVTLCCGVNEFSTTRVLRGAIVQDEPNILGGRGHADIEVDSECI